MNALAEAAIRRHWPALAALLLLALLTAVDQLWFRPTAARYARTLRQATELGMPLDPSRMPRMIPPRVFALIADNSLPAAQAAEAANSGSLTAEFLGEITQHMGQRHVSVISTEPGPTSQDSHSVQLRAHVKAHGHYTDFVMLLDDFAHDRRLFGIDRFNLTPEPGSGVFVELWMSRLVLKAGGAS